MRAMPKFTRKFEGITQPNLPKRSLQTQAVRLPRASNTPSPDPSPALRRRDDGTSSGSLRANSRRGAWAPPRPGVTRRACVRAETRDLDRGRRDPGKPLTAIVPRGFMVPRAALRVIVDPRPQIIASS